MKGHSCIDGLRSEERSWWVNDAKGIPLVRVCKSCGQYIGHGSL